MDGTGKRVSVIIPTYKRRPNYLSRAIESVESQTYQNIEIIVVDDNHPDSEYRREIREFMRQYEGSPNIVYIENPRNMGGSLARNNGIDRATGDYITFLDDDDEYLPKKVERQLEFMLQNGYDMSFTDLKVVGNLVVDYREFGFLKSFDRDTLLKAHLMRHLTGTPTFMYKTEKLRQIGGFEDVKMGQEFYLMLRTIEGGLKVGYLAECHAIAHRHGDGGISHGANKINGEREIYRFKKKYFSIFTIRERMFIRFRYFAVMTVAYIRNENYFKAFVCGIAMFFVSPVDFAKEVSWFIIKNIRARG